MFIYKHTCKPEVEYSKSYSDHVTFLVPCY